ncbi:hypothetical protein GEMRC1_004323 [Eukaryota sp. GEM-RC1]
MGPTCSISTVIPSCYRDMSAPDPQEAQFKATADLHLSRMKKDLDFLLEQQESVSNDLQKVVLNHAPAFISSVSETHHLSSLVPFLSTKFSRISSSLNRLSSTIPKVSSDLVYPNIAPHSCPADDPVASSSFDTSSKKSSSTACLRLPSILFLSNAVAVLIVEGQLSKAVDQLIHSQEKLLKTQQGHSDKESFRGSFSVTCATSALDQVKSELIPLLLSHLKSLCEASTSSLMSLKLDDTSPFIPPSPHLFSSSKHSFNTSKTTSKTPSTSEYFKLLVKLGESSLAVQTILQTYSRTSRQFLINSRLSSSFVLPQSLTSLIEKSGSDIELLPSLYWCVFKVCRLLQFTGKEMLRLKKDQNCINQSDLILMTSWIGTTGRRLLMELIPTARLGHNSTSCNHILNVFSIIKQPIIFDGIASFLRNQDLQNFRFFNLNHHCKNLKHVNSEPFDVLKKHVFLCDKFLSIFTVIDTLVGVLLNLNDFNSRFYFILFASLKQLFKSVLDGIYSIFPSKSNRNLEIFHAFFTLSVWIAHLFPSLVEVAFSQQTDHSDQSDLIDENADPVVVPSIVDYLCPNHLAPVIFNLQPTAQQKSIEDPRIHKVLPLATNSLIEVLLHRTLVQKFDWGRKIIEISENVESISNLYPSIISRDVVRDFVLTLDAIPRFHLISLYVFKRSVFEMFSKFQEPKFLNNFTKVSTVTIHQILLDFNYLKAVFWSILPNGFSIKPLSDVFVRVHVDHQVKNSQVSSPLPDESWFSDRVKVALDDVSFPDLSTS